MTQGIMWFMWTICRESPAEGAGKKRSEEVKKPWNR